MGEGRYGKGEEPLGTLQQLHMLENVEINTVLVNPWTEQCFSCTF